MNAQRFYRKLMAIGMAAALMASSSNMVIAEEQQPITAEQAAADEAARIAQEQAAAEAARIAQEQAAAEAARIAQEQAAAEAARIAQEQAAAEAARIAQEQAAAEAARIAQEQAAAEAARAAQEVTVAETEPVTQETASIEDTPLMSVSGDTNENPGSADDWLEETSETENPTPPEGGAVLEETGEEHFNDIVAYDAEETDKIISKNAMQKAVDAALKNAQETKAAEVTVLVDDGMYDGDVVISWKNAEAAAQNMENIQAAYENREARKIEFSEQSVKLYLLTKDSVQKNEQTGKTDKNTISASSKGEANMKGNLTIDGIDVILAGIWYSMNTTIEAKDAAVKIYGTEKDDQVTLKLNNAAAEIATGEGLDHIDVSGQGDGAKNIWMDGGNGYDVYNVDTSVGYKDENKTETSVVISDSGVGIAEGGRLHFTGKLGDGDDRASGYYNKETNTAELNFKNNDSRKIRITTTGVDSFTDELENKATVDITKYANEHDHKYEVKDTNFTNFVYKPDVSKTKNLSVPVELEMIGEGLLNHLVIENGETKDLEIRRIIAEGMNLSLKGRNIKVLSDGVVRALNVLMSVEDDDLMGSYKVPVAGINVNFSFFDFVNDIEILLEEGSQVTATGGSVVLKADSKMHRPVLPALISQLDGISFANVKVNRSNIYMKGRVDAVCAIEAHTLSEVDIKASNKMLAGKFIPVSVGVVVADAGVHVDKNAILHASGDVKLSAESRVNVSTMATTGALPISLATSVALNDAAVQVEGSIISEQGDIVLFSSGKMDVATKSARKSLGKDPTGGFFAVSEAKQDVDSKVTGAGSLSAVNGNITVKSSSDEKVDTEALSADLPKEDDEAKAEEAKSYTLNSALKEIKNAVIDTLTGFGAGVAGNLKDSFSNWWDSRAKEISLAEKEENLISVGNCTNGTLSVRGKAGNDQEVTVKALPNKGYKLSGMYYTYLIPGASEVTTVDIKDNTFIMPDAPVTVFAVFQETTEEDEDPDQDVSGLFEDQEEDEDLDLESLFEEGTAGTEDEKYSVENPKMTGKYEIQNFTAEEDNKDKSGKVSIGSVLSNHQKADAGERVTLIVNPAEGKRLQDGSLKLLYTRADGKKITYKLKKTQSGQYIFTMPELSETDLVLKIEAGFENIPDEAEEARKAKQANDAKRSYKQVTGALAVNIVTNNNHAYIDTTGTITTKGKLEVLAEANTSSFSAANGSGVEGKKESPASPGENPQDEVTAAQTIGEVRIEGTKNGAVILLSSKSPSGGDTVAFEVSPRKGYRLTKYNAKGEAATDGEEAILASYEYEDENGKKITVKNEKLKHDAKGNWYIKLPNRLVGLVSIRASFTPDLYEISLDEGLNTGEGKISIAKEAKTDDDVEITVTDLDERQKLTALTYTYEEDGKKKEGTLEVTRNEDGKYVIRMPKRDITITKSTFEKKPYQIYVDKASKDNGIKLDVSAGEEGDTVRIVLANPNLTPSEVSVKYGLMPSFEKFDEEEPDFDTSENQYEIMYDKAIGGFVIPKSKLSEGPVLIIVSAKTSEKDITVDVYNKESMDGDIVVQEKASAGEKVALEVKAHQGYLLKDDKIMVSVWKKDGSLEEFEAVYEQGDRYVFTVPESDESNPIERVRINAEFEKGEKKNSLSLGVGVDVSVVRHRNHAYIKNGHITAGELKVEAISGTKDPVTAAAESYAGYSDGDIGIGGAVTVHVASAKTTARIMNTADIIVLNDGAVSVKAASRENFRTIGDAAVKVGTAKKTGVGAGIAVAVTGVDVFAGIEDNSNIRSVSENVIALKNVEAAEDVKIAYVPEDAEKTAAKLGSLDVTTTHFATEKTDAKAGSAGGVSVTPVITVNVSGMRSEAYIGKVDQAPAIPAGKAEVEGQWQIRDDVHVNAASNIYREVAANAAAAGGSVGVGASPVVTVYNDSTGARVSRSIRANNIKVHAQGISRVHSTSRAGSKGATKKSSSDESSEGAQKGESDEQADRSIGGASKLAGSTGISNLDPGVLNNQTANRQTAQTSEGNVQVAAAFNLNVMKHRVTAYIDENIAVKAEDTLEVSSVGQTDAKVYANASATQAKTGVGVAVALNIVSYDNLAYIDQAAVEAKNLIVSASMPKEDDEDDTEDKTPIWEKDPKEVEKSVENWMEDELQTLVRDALKTLGVDNLQEKLVEKAKEKIVNEVKTRLNQLWDGIKDNAKKVFSKKDGKEESTSLENVTPADIEKKPEKKKALRDVIAEKVVEVVEKEAKQLLVDLGRALTSTAVDGLYDWLNVDVKNTDYGVTSTFVTEAIAGAGASDVGVAGSVAIGVIHGNVKAYIGASGNVVNAEDELSVKADGAQKEETTASAAVGGDGSRADKNLGSNDKSGSNTETPSGQSEKKDGHVIFSATKHGVYEITQTNEGRSVSITPDAYDGYSLDSVKVYNTKSGKEIKVNELYGSYVFTVPELGDGETITVKVLFKENPTTKIRIQQSAGGRIHIATPQTAENQASAEARDGDKILVRLEPEAGKKLNPDTLYLFGKDEKGQDVSVKIIAVEDAATNTYLVYLPKLKVSEGASITAEFIDDPDYKQGEEKQNKTKQGKTVGVGAAFALDVVSFVAESYIGKNRPVTAGKAEVTADGRHYRTTASVSGTDPLSGENSAGMSETAGKEKDVSVDASVAIGLTDLQVKAHVDEGAVITTNGVGEAKENAALNPGDFVLSAQSLGHSLTSASGFSAGQNTAVGAAIAVNIADSDVNASFDGTGNIKRDATVKSYTYNADDSYALATAIGADIQRYLNKFKDIKEKGTEAADKFLNGDYDDLVKDDDQKDNQTADKINDKLNANKNNSNQSGKSDRSDAKKGLSTSSNILNTQNVSTESTDSGSKPGEAIAAAETETKNNTKSTNEAESKYQLPNSGSKEESKSIQAAAAVGLNITNHVARTDVNGSITSGGRLQFLSDNDGNFRTRGSGATMTLGASNFAVAVGVAVSVNKNQSLVNIREKLELTAAGDVDIAADLSQNMDGKYRGYLGAQALAGSVSESAKASIAGAVSVLVSRSETRARVGSGVKINAGKTGNVSVTANDKSKLAVRAGGYSVTVKDTKVGIGASVAFIYAYNKVIAEILDATKANPTVITAKDVRVRAVREAVTKEDYELPMDLSNLISRSDEDVDAANQGIIHLQKTGDEKDTSYEVTVNMDTQRVLDSIDLLNFLSSVNYYAEAIAGAVSGESKLAASGSVAMIFTFNDVEARIGKYVQINADGDMEVAAQSDANTRMIAGSLAAGKTNIGAGVSIGVFYNEDQVLTIVADNAELSAVGTYTQSAAVHNDELVINAAAQWADKLSAGGSLGVIVMKNHTASEAGASARITAGSDISITADTEDQLLIISANAGKGSSAAVGGTLNIIVNNGEAEVAIGSYTQIISTKGSVKLAADTREKLISILGSVSAATSGTGVAGTVSVLVTNAKSRVSTANSSVINAAKDVQILANTSAKLFQINAGVAVGSSTAVGAVISVNIIKNQALIEAGSSRITSVNGNVNIQSDSGNKVLVVLADVGAGSNAIGGVIPVVVSGSKAKSEIGNNSTGRNTVISAGDSIGVIAHADTGAYLIAAGLQAAGSMAFGGVIDTAVIENEIVADVADYVQMYTRGINAASTAAGGIGTPNREERRHGVIVSATGQEDIVMIDVAAGGAGSIGVNGAVGTLIVRNKVAARVREHTSVSVLKDTAEITVEADDDAEILNLAGSLSAAGTIGVGASAAVLIFDKEVIAETGATANITSSGKVNVTANAKDDLWLLAVGFGAAGTVGVAGDASVLIFQNKVHAIVGGKIESTYDVNVQAKTDSHLYNIAAGVAGGGVAGASGVAVVTYFYNETLAYVKANSRISGRYQGDVNILADSSEYVNGDAVGASLAGVAAVGGAADVLVTKVVTKAYTEENVEITDTLNVNVKANDKYELFAVVGTASASGVAGVSVSVLASVSYNTVIAEIGRDNTIMARARQFVGGSVNVSAQSNRNIQGYAASVAFGGATGIGVPVMVITAGSLLSEDAHKAIYASDSKGKAMDPQTQVTGTLGMADSRAAEYQPRESMDDLLASDGSSAEDTAKAGGQLDYNSFGQTEDKEGAYDQAADGIRKKEGTRGATVDQKMLTDTTSARIATGSLIKAAGSVEVLATDNLQTRMISGALAGGGIAGIGAGVSVAVLYSNVLATVEEGAVIQNTSVANPVHVYVMAKSGARKVSESEKQELSLKVRDKEADADSIVRQAKSQDGQNKKAIEDAAILVMSAAGSGGLVGVSAAVASLNLMNRTYATMSGDVKGHKYANVMVEADANYGNSVAMTVGGSAGLIGITGSVAVANAESDTRAQIGNGAKLTNTGGVTVKTKGTMNITAASAAIAAGLGTVSVPVAVAVNRSAFKATILGAEIEGSKTKVIVDGALTSNGNAYVFGASANLAGVGVSAAVAVNRAVQESVVGEEHAQTKPILNIQELKVSGTVQGNTTVNGMSMSAGLAEINGIVALAFNRVENTALIRAAEIIASGKIDVGATLYGSTVTKVSDVSVSALGVGAVVAASQLKSENRAAVDADHATIKAQSLSIKAVTKGLKDEKSTATVDIVTGSIAAVGYKVNVAWAENHADNVAELLGTAGRVEVAEDAAVYAEGILDAYVEARGSDHALLNVTITEESAGLTAQQTARIDGVDVVSQKGNVNVQAILKADSYAKIRPAQGNSADVKLFGEKVSKASAKSASENRAYIQNANVMADQGKLDVQAKTDTTVEAAIEEQKISGSLVNFGITRTETDTNDTVESYIGRNQETDKEKEVSAQQINIHAAKTVKVTANGTLPYMNIALAGYRDVEVVAKAESDTKHHTTAYTGKDTKVIAKGHQDGSDTLNELTGVEILAKSDVTLKADIPETKQISGVSYGDYHIKNEIGTVNTQAAVYGTVESEDAVIVRSENVIDGQTSGNVTSVGALNGSEAVAENKVKDQTSRVQIGNNARITAFGDISMKAVSGLQLSSNVVQNTAAVAAKNDIKAVNTATRTTMAEIGKSVEIVSQIGNIELVAQEKQADGSKLVSTATGDEKGALGVGAPKASITYHSTVNTKVGAASSITAKYGSMDIAANANSILLADSSLNALKAFGKNESRSEIDSTLNVGTDIGVMNGNDSAYVSLLGQIVKIGAYIESQTVEAVTRLDNVAIAGNTRAEAVTDVKNTVKTNIGAGAVRGIDQIIAEAMVLEQQIKAKADAEIKGATGKVYAYSTVKGYNQVDVVIDDTALLAGKDIVIRALAPEIVGERVVSEAQAVSKTVVGYATKVVDEVLETVENFTKKLGVFGWLANKVVKVVRTVTQKVVKVVLYSDSADEAKTEFQNTGKVKLGGLIHLGGGAAGMYMDIFDGVVKYAGLDKDLTGKDDLIYSADETTLKIKQMYNNDGGHLNIDTGYSELTGKVFVISNEAIPKAEITNHTDKELVLRNIRTISLDIEESTSTVNAGRYASSEIGDQLKTIRTMGAIPSDEITGRAREQWLGEFTPQLLVEAKGNGNVVFEDGTTVTASEARYRIHETDCGEGQVVLRLNGGDVLTKGRDTFVAANELLISGARNIGNGAADKFRAYIFDLSEYLLEDGTSLVEAKSNRISAEAEQDIFMELTLVREWMTDTAYAMRDASEEHASLHIDRVEGTGTVYLDVRKPLELNGNQPDFAGLEEDMGVTIPNTRMQSVTLEMETVRGYQIAKISDNTKGTDFWITDDGMIANRAAAVSFDADTYREEKTLEDMQSGDPYDYYLLPNGALVLVGNQPDKSYGNKRRIGNIDAIVQRDYDDTTGDGLFDLRDVMIDRYEVSLTDQDSTHLSIDLYKNGSETVRAIDGYQYLPSVAAMTQNGLQLPNGMLLFKDQETGAYRALKADGTAADLVVNYDEEDGDTLLAIAPQMTHSLNESGEEICTYTKNTAGLLLLRIDSTTDTAILNGSWSGYAAVRDADGRIVLDEQRRVLDAGTAQRYAQELGDSDITSGTVLYLDHKGDIAGYLKRKNNSYVLRAYETVSFQNETVRAYTEYWLNYRRETDVTSKNKDTIEKGYLQMTLSADAPSYFQLLSNYMLTSVHGLHSLDNRDNTSGFHYFDASYFALGMDGRVGLLDRYADESKPEAEKYDVRYGYKNGLLWRDSTGMETARSYGLYDVSDSKDAEPLMDIIEGLKTYRTREVNKKKLVYDYTKSFFGIGYGEKQWMYKKVSERVSLRNMAVFIVPDQYAVYSDGYVERVEKTADRVYVPLDGDIDVIMSSGMIGGNVIYETAELENGNSIRTNGKISAKRFDVLNQSSNNTLEVKPVEAPKRKLLKARAGNRASDEEIQTILPTSQIFFRGQEQEDGTYAVYNGKVHITAEGDVEVLDSLLGEAAEVTITSTNGDITFDKLEMSDSARLELTMNNDDSIRGLLFMRNTILKDSAELILDLKNTKAVFDKMLIEDHALLKIVSDSDAEIGEKLEVQGRLYLKLDGSLYGSSADSTDMIGSRLTIGNDMAAQESYLSVGGDIGTKEVPLTVETSDNSQLKIADVNRLYIRGASRPESYAIRMIDAQRVLDEMSEEELYRYIAQATGVSETEVRDAFADTSEAGAQRRSDLMAEFNIHMPEELQDRLFAQIDGHMPTLEGGKALNIVVEELRSNDSDAVFISNDGDVSLTVNHGNLNIDRIESGRSDLHEDGAIFGDVTIRIDGDATGNDLKGIRAANVYVQNESIALSDGEPFRLETDQGVRSTKTLSMGDIEYDEDEGRFSATVMTGVIALYDNQKAGTFSIETDRDVEITETDGDLGVGVIHVTAEDGTIRLISENGSVVDRRSEEQKRAELANAQAHTIEISTGDGAKNSIGKQNAPLTVKTGEDGKAILTSGGDVYLNTQGSLEAEVRNAGSETGKVYITADDQAERVDLTLADQIVGNIEVPNGAVNVVKQSGKPDLIVEKITAGTSVSVKANHDITVGSITAGTTAELTAENGDIAEGERDGAPAAITAKTMILRADDQVGNYRKPLEVEVTEGGSLSVHAERASIAQIRGDLKITDTVIEEDLELSAPGNIIGENTVNEKGEVNPAVIVGGDLTLTAGGSVGTDQEPFTYKVAGSVNVIQQNGGASDAGDNQPVLQPEEPNTDPLGADAESIRWNTLPKAGGYDVFAQVNGKKITLSNLLKTVRAGSPKKAMKAIQKLLKKKLKNKKNYKVMIRAFDEQDGKRIYRKGSMILYVAGRKSKRTNAKSVKVKQKTLKLKVKKTKKLIAEITRENAKKALLAIKGESKLRYWSSDETIATVSRSGKIKALKKGSCVIYMMALNGVTAQMKLKVGKK